MAALSPSFSLRRLPAPARALAARLRRNRDGGFSSSRAPASPEARATRVWITLAVIALLLSLLARLPAALAYGWLAPKLPPNIQLQGVSGTLLSGAAAGVSFDSRPALSDVRWRLKPLWLLAGRIALDLEAGNPADPDSVVLTSGISRTFLGTVRLSDTHASGSLRAAAALAGYPYVPVAGTIDAVIPSLRVEQGAIRQLEGSVRLADLRWSLAQPPIGLGDYRLDLSTETGGATGPLVRGVVASESGPMDTDGGLTLGPDRTYQVALGLRPKAGAPPLLTSLVQSFGPVGDRGYYRLNKQGAY